MDLLIYRAWELRAYTFLGDVRLALIVQFYDTDTNLGRLLQNSL